MDPVERLLAIEAIKQLKARYFRCLDTKDHAGLAEVFAEDAWFDARNSHRDGDGPETLHQVREDAFPRGRAAIVAFIAGRTAPARTLHHGHCHEIELLAPDAARGVIAMEDSNRVEQDGRIVYSLHGFGHYHETYRRIDGRWLIQTSRLTRLRADVVDLRPTTG